MITEIKPWLCRNEIQSTLHSPLSSVMLSRVSLSAFLCLSLAVLVSARNLVRQTQQRFADLTFGFSKVEDDNETVGRRLRNTTDSAPSSYYQEDPPNYPHQLIVQLLQNFTPLPGLFDNVGKKPGDLENRDVISLVSVHHNNLDLDREILK